MNFRWCPAIAVRTILTRSVTEAFGRASLTLRVGVAPAPRGQDTTELSELLGPAMPTVASDQFDREAEDLAVVLPTGPRLVVIGSTSFWHAQSPPQGVNERRKVVTMSFQSTLCLLNLVNLCSFGLAILVALTTSSVGRAELTIKEALLRKRVLEASSDEAKAEAYKTLFAAVGRPGLKALT